MKSSLSIVIPHKDSPDKLERLLQSIPLDEGMEVVVVDDDSAPGRQAQQLAGRFPRVSFLANESGENNAGQARNIGLRQVTGEWVIFADADDFFVQGAFRVIDECLAAANEDTDMICFNATSMNEATGRETWRHNSVARLFSLEDHSARERRARYDWTQPWAKAVRTRMIRKKGIAFDSVAVSNDVIFSQKCGHHARAVKLNNSVIYCITEGCGTLSATTSEDEALTRLEVRMSSGRNMMQWQVDWPFSWGAKWFFASRPWKPTRRKLSLYGRYALFVARKVLYSLNRKLSL